MNATVVQNVVTYDTIIDFQNQDMKLFPGMTAYVSIPVQSVTNVMMVPNGALRYTPDLPADQLSALLKQYGIQTGARAQQSAAGGGAGMGGARNRRSAQNGGGDQAQGASAAEGGNFGARRSRGENAGGAANANPAMAAGGEGAEVPGGGVRQRRNSNEIHDRSADFGLVWKQGPDNTFIPIQIHKGLTDHTVTQVVAVTKGDLKVGDSLIIGARTLGTTATAAPGMGGGRGGFRGR
jgi:HlyD family secretion protein